MKILPGFPEIWAKLEKCPSFIAMLKNPFKKFLDPYPDVDNFENLTSSF